MKKVLILLPLFFFASTFILIGSLSCRSNCVLGMFEDSSKNFPQVPQTTPAPYPLKVGSAMAPFVSARSAVVLDVASQKVMYGKNINLRFSPASTVKIMTALVALEKFSLDQILTVKEEINQPSTIYLRVGEEISFENLLYGLLLNSGNDAAAAIAQNYKGGEVEFINLMNEKTRELYLLDTHFVDAAGLDDDGNFTTALDLARLATEAIKNETLANIFATKEKVVFDKTGTVVHKLYNLNKLLGANGVNGIKTGTSIGAGEVLVSSAKRNGHTIAVVVLKSEDRFSDSIKLIDWAFENFQFVDRSILLGNITD